MTTGHLITHADLTTLGDIDFGLLDNTCRQFVADSQVEALALELGFHLLVLSQVVEDAAANQVVLVLVGSPVVQ